MPNDAEIDALIKRLGYHREHPLRGGYTLINPDGPEAAAFLAALRDDRDIIADRIRIVDQRMKECCDEAQNFYERADKAEARVRELEQKLERARLALEPFAREGSKLTPDLDKYSWLNTGLSNANFRHARAALAEIGQRG